MITINLIIFKYIDHKNIKSSQYLKYIFAYFTGWLYFYFTPHIVYITLVFIVTYLYDVSLFCTSLRCCDTQFH